MQTYRGVCTIKILLNNKHKIITLIIKLNNNKLKIIKRKNIECCLRKEK